MLEQKYQNFTGKLTTGNVVAPIMEGKLDGDRIAFTAGDTRYTGQVKGGTMEGTSIAAARRPSGRRRGSRPAEALF